MIKGTVRSLFLLTMLFLSIFFIDIMGASAASECSCWYYAENNIETSYMSGAESAAASGNVEKTKKTFLIEMKYSANSADVIYSCSASTESTENLNPLDLKKKCGDSDNVINRGNPFNVDSGAIARDNCSESACNSAKIKLWCGKDVVTAGYNDTGLCPDGVKDFKSITKEQAEAIKNSDNASQEADEQKVSDRSQESNVNQKEGIINWAKGAKDDKYLGEYSSGCDIIGHDVLVFLNNLFLIIQVIGIILLVFLSSVEFIKVITGSEDEGLSKALKNTLRRVIIVIILLILPMLITWVLEIVNDNNYLTDENGKVVIGDDGNPLCRDGYSSGSGGGSSSTVQSGSTENGEILVTSISLNKKDVTLEKGESTRLSAKVIPRKARNKSLTWTSSNKKVVTVSSRGVVKAIGKGKATITVATKDGQKKATCKVKVTIPVTGVKLNHKTITIIKGKSVILKATVLPKKASTKNLTWTSSNNSVATVNSKGKITAIKQGTATIMVKTANGKKASCKVIVNASAEFKSKTFNMSKNRVGGMWHEVGIQGFCVADNFFAFALTSNEHATVYLIDKNNSTVYDSKALGIEHHANTLCYDPVKKIIIVSATGKRPVMFKINSKKLTRINKSYSNRSGQIVYSQKNDLFMVTSGKSVWVYTRDAFYNNGKALRSFSLKYSPGGDIPQGRACFGDHIFISYTKYSSSYGYTGNIIYAFDINNGVLRQKINDSTTGKELEQVSFDKSGNMYAAYNKGNDIYKTNYNYYSNIKK